MLSVHHLASLTLSFSSVNKESKVYLVELYDNRYKVDERVLNETCFGIGAC